MYIGLINLVIQLKNKNSFKWQEVKQFNNLV